MGRKSRKIEKQCPVCKLAFYVSPSRSTQITCAKKCYGIYHSGEHNPNFGKKWSEEKKRLQSEKIKSTVDHVYKYKAGSANRGKKFSAERIEAMHGHRDSSSYSHPHSDESKRIIGLKSSEKWTDEYKKRQYELGVATNRIIPDDMRTDFEIYQRESHWIKRMWDLVEGSELVQKLGTFNPNNNTSGCVRDHRISKTDGFKLGLFPEILRHPVNCQIISHSENSSKGEKSSITARELIDNIRTYDKIWDEQSIVLDLINRWESGERFSANEYRRKS